MPWKNPELHPGLHVRLKPDIDAKIRALAERRGEPLQKIVEKLILSGLYVKGKAKLTATQKDEVIRFNFDL
jgi:hypothetical protein